MLCFVFLVSAYLVYFDGGQEFGIVILERTGRAKKNSGSLSLALP